MQDYKKQEQIQLEALKNISYCLGLYSQLCSRRHTRQVTYNVVSKDDVTTDPEDAHEDTSDTDAGPNDHVVILLCPLLQRVHDQEAVVMTDVGWGKRNI